MLNALSSNNIVFNHYYDDSTAGLEFLSNPWGATPNVNFFAILKEGVNNPETIAQLGESEQTLEMFAQGHEQILSLDEQQEFSRKTISAVVGILKEVSSETQNVTELEEHFPKFFAALGIGENLLEYLYETSEEGLRKDRLYALKKGLELTKEDFPMETIFASMKGRGVLYSDARQLLLACNKALVRFQSFFISFITSNEELNKTNYLNKLEEGSAWINLEEISDLFEFFPQIPEVTEMKQNICLVAVFEAIATGRFDLFKIYFAEYFQKEGWGINMLLNKAFTWFQDPAFLRIQELGSEGEPLPDWVVRNLANGMQRKEPYFFKRFFQKIENREHQHQLADALINEYINNSANVSPVLEMTRFGNARVISDCLEEIEAPLEFSLDERLQGVVEQQFAGLRNSFFPSYSGIVLAYLAALGIRDEEMREDALSEVQSRVWQNRVQSLASSPTVLILIPVIAAYFYFKS